MSTEKKSNCRDGYLAITIGGRWLFPQKWQIVSWGEDYLWQSSSGRQAILVLMCQLDIFLLFSQKGKIFFSTYRSIKYSHLCSICLKMAFMAKENCKTKIKLGCVLNGSSNKEIMHIVLQHEQKEHIFEHLSLH